MASDQIATAHRSSSGWVITVDHAQIHVRSLVNATDAAAEYLAATRGGTPADHPVQLAVDLGGYEAEVARARDEMAAAEQRLADAQSAWRAVAQQLRDSGISRRDSGIVMGLSHTRVSQLLES